ncbi:putative iron-regulated membrane protein [Novosphingobium sp. PhB165]|uniref:PepSY-associated TM helix domain-containing protein n=1 Tax=Novosphingobium sp. PhB165 TaxID=2485105 RepID=UPI00105089DC|nr:PepSY-associated TM helix domain-containing protein [Novosphingobium sp. PhB165]TCM16936.1 putative iron-regulated membrane protein [Novosphingobium sp. PhB165]
MKSVPRSPWIVLHRYLGLAAIPFLFIAAITGSVLCFVRPIDAWLNADLFRQPVAVAHPTEVVGMMDRFVQAHPEWIVRGFPIAVPGDLRIPVKVDRAVGREGPAVDQIFLDRATGAIAGGRSTEAAFNRRGMAEWLVAFHSKLVLGTGGRWLMGLVAIAWLVGHLIGFYLSFPLRKPFWKGWKKSWKVSFRSLLPKFMHDWHQASALWLFVPLTVLALTSIGFNFFSEAYAPAVEALFAKDKPDAAKTLPQGTGTAPMTFADAVTAARAEAARTNVSWQPATVLTDPKEGTVGVTMTDDGRLNYHGLGPIYYYFDRKSGALVKTLDPYHGDSELAGYRLLYPLHSGRIGGNLTILLVFLSGLATAGLCVTGVYVWWKKRQSRVAARKAQAKRAAAIVGTGRVIQAER